MAVHPDEQSAGTRAQVSQAVAKVISTFPDGQSTLMLVAAWLRYVSTSHWGDQLVPGYGTMSESGRPPERIRN